MFHASADWWGLWWLAVFGTVLFAAGHVPGRRARRRAETGANRGTEPGP